MQRLNASDSGFADAFDALVNGRREADADVSRDVVQTIRDVRAHGDATLVEMTQRFDGFDLNDNGWQIDAAQCKAAYEGLDADLRDALTLAAKRIEAYHQAQLPENRDYRDSDNVRLGARWSAVDAAGVYVPGGRAAYPSSVLMNIIPAKVAGVARIVMVTPTPGGETNQTVMAAAHVAGVDEIWRVGGAQAIAALAYGTDRIRPVDVITGPGNAWVAEAKRQLYGVVGIDMVAGPSEIVVVADAQNDPDWIAADLLSQAEHDPTSQSILFIDNADFADQVSAAVDVQLAALSTGAVARASWTDFGAIVVVDDLEGAMPLVNRLAAEHLELAVDDDRAERLFDLVRHAGSVFLGRMTPEAIGDYVAGPNHVLPTGRRARFASGLSVLDFMKRTSFIALDRNAINVIGPAAATLADAEGLPAHAASVRKKIMSAHNASAKSKSRSAARLASVQALYQMDMEDIGIARLLNEFHSHRLGQEIEDAQYADADPDFFDDVVSGVDARRAEIDALVDGKLGEKWKMDRLDKTMLQLLRCGTYELIARPDVPTATVIDEYLDVAHAFFDKKDAKFVNGLLDAVAKDVRPR